jgi:hypothetical protein
LVVAPDFEQAPPLLTFVAAVAGTAVSEAATSAAVPATTRTLRNMKTSIDGEAILPIRRVHLMDVSRENRVS